MKMETKLRYVFYDVEQLLLQIIAPNTLFFRLKMAETLQDDNVFKRFQLPNIPFSAS